MKSVNDILNGKKLNEHLQTASRAEVLELRYSASVCMGLEKQIRDSGHNTEKTRKYICFLSAVIQECDKSLALLKKVKAKQRADLAALAAEYDAFKKLTRSIAGNSMYSQILSQIKKDADQ